MEAIVLLAPLVLGSATGPDAIIADIPSVAVLAAWGPYEDRPEDLDLSGAIDFDDLLIALATWGPC
jgi:hypothetical protein